METRVEPGQSAETAADRYATTLKLVNDWHQSQAAAKGGEHFRCPRCDAPRFVSAASKTRQRAVLLARAHHAARAERRKPDAERRAERRKPEAARLHLRGPGPEMARVAKSRGRRRRAAWEHCLGHAWRCGAGKGWQREFAAGGCRSGSLALARGMPSEGALRSGSAMRPRIVRAGEKGGRREGGAGLGRPRGQRGGRREGRAVQKGRAGEGGAGLGLKPATWTWTSAQ